MELLPLGPVVFLDTAGMDDSSELAELRIEDRKVFDRSDVVVLLLEPRGVDRLGGGDLSAGGRRRRPP